MSPFLVLRGLIAGLALVVSRIVERANYNILAQGRPIESYNRWIPRAHHYVYLPVDNETSDPSSSD